MNYNPNQNMSSGYDQSSYRSFTNPGTSIPPSNQSFPDISDSFMPPSSSSNLPVPYTPEVLPPPKKGLANLINLEQIKGIIDRMGGIDGILNTVNKMQSVINSVAQMAPMVKLLFGSLKKGNKSGSGSKTQGTYSKSRKRRKKTTRKNYKRKRKSRR